MATMTPTGSSKPNTTDLYAWRMLPSAISVVVRGPELLLPQLELPGILVGVRCAAPKPRFCHPG